MPVTLKDMFNRNTRMGGGLLRLYFHDGLQCLKMFFKTLFRKDVPFGLKMTYLDQYCNLAIVPAGFLCLVWFGFYYIYSLIYTAVAGPIVIPGLGSYNFHWFLMFVVIVASCLFLLPFFFQPLAAYISERKKLTVTKPWIAVLSILLYPFYIIIDAISIFGGFFMKSKWRKVNRSNTKIQQ